MGTWMTRWETEDLGEESTDDDPDYAALADDAAAGMWTEDSDGSEDSDAEPTPEDEPDASGRFPSLPPQPMPMDHAVGYKADLHTSAANGPCCPMQVKAHNARPNALSMLRAREASTKGTDHGWSPAQCCHMSAFHAIPCHPTKIIDTLPSRAYIGQFSAKGDRFIAAFQRDRRIKIYDVDRGWQLAKDVHCRNLRWTVTDTCLSPEQTFLLYASITPVVHMVNMENSNVQSEANVTDIHEALHFDQRYGRQGEPLDDYSSFGIWSLRWGSDQREVVAGTGDACVNFFNVELAKTVHCVPAHTEDVNAVAYVDPYCQIVASGSDDKLIKIWDRRCVGNNSRQPQGVLVGHTEGITHLDPKGDGTYLISNSKDQTIKLWDMRMLKKPGSIQPLSPRQTCSYQWDYRWMEYPGRGRDVRHPNDTSVMTYRGHQVLRTLMRAYWAPAHTTGQRYIYTGSFDGSVVVYDVVSGRVVQRLRYHNEIVRDCSWHPYQPLLVSACFDGSLCQWEHKSHDADRDTKRLPLPSYDRLEDDY